MNDDGEQFCRGKVWEVFDVSDVVKAFYRDILVQVLSIESRKKQVSQRLLLNKSERMRLRIIREFLSLDLDKHTLLQQAAVVGFQNQEFDVLDHLCKLYKVEAYDELPERIREEVQRTERLLVPIINEIRYPKTGGFFERRLVQEVNKYVTLQAREYVKVKL